MEQVQFAAPHVPVMLNEVMDALTPVAGEVYVDCTMGAGGYTRAILDSADCKVVAFDRDQTAHEMAGVWAGSYKNRLVLIKNSFGSIADSLRAAGFEKVDAIILDLGVSSMQLDDGSRGFSFRFDAPLDMRMDRTQGQTAADIVNFTPEKELADIIYLYGEERHSRRVAAAIVKARAVKKIETTLELAEIIRGVLPGFGKDKIDPATRTFQALRIAVNHELDELTQVLESSEDLLNIGGRLIVVTFHSLEDRIVKVFMNSRAKAAPAPSRHLPPQQGYDQAQNRFSFSLLTKKPVLPTDEEMKFNPRSRSAKLRAALRQEVA